VTGRTPRKGRLARELAIVLVVKLALLTLLCQLLRAPEPVRRPGADAVQQRLLGTRPRQGDEDGG
jgi:hypothetical protein